MSGEAEFRIGTRVVCSDGATGELRRVILDPAARAIADIVVQSHRHDGRIVPISHVESVTDSIRLSITGAQLEGLDSSEEIELLTGAPGPNLGEQGVQFSFLGGGAAAEGTGLYGMYGATAPQPMMEDRVPEGDVEIEKGEPVYATDGPIGRIHGIAADAEHHVTHILLASGHLWGEHNIAIPIDAVKRLDDGVSLNLSKEQVKGLPPG